MDLAKHMKPLIGESDWPMWKRKIRDLLDYHEGALDVIEGRLVKPGNIRVEPGRDATETEVKNHKEKCDLYRKANSYAKSMITSSVTDAVYQKIMDKETAREAWDALKLQFEATSKDQLFKICTEFFAFTWTSSEDVSTHIAKLKSLWNELNNGLETKGEYKLPDLIMLCKILHILPSKFESFRSSWMLLTKENEKTVDEITMQLCVFERNCRKTEETGKFTQEALMVKSPTQENKTRSGFSGAKKDDSCNYCKKKGHWVRSCRKWIADGRPTKKEIGNTQNRAGANESLLTICNEVCTTESNLNDWWIDNGATKHVTNQREFFVEFEEFETRRKIKAAGKETIDAVGKGTIEVLNNKHQILSLKDVWYVPQISRNLLSVLAAQDRNENSKFESTASRCKLVVNGKEVLRGVREVCGTLYKAMISPIIPKIEVDASIVIADSSILQLYHERWGHQDKRYVKEMLEKELDIKVKLDTELCEPCIYGKAHRLPFGTRKKASAPGELMFTDVCGPFDESFGKKRYLVVFKDSYTKFRYGYLVKEKSEVKEVLSQMILHAKTQGHTLKELLSDNGGEFDNPAVRKILGQNGISQRLTAPYTPQQNGGCERENRTIVEMARTFKYSNEEVKFPEAIWAELVNTAVYILNRTGKSGERVTPYELWLGTKPRIKHLRIIGSTCYIHVPKEKRRKMDVKAIKGYLVGYDGDERYRIYLKEDHKVVLSRDVKFQEKTGDCEEKVELPLRNLENEDNGVEGHQEEEEEENIEIETGSEEEDDNTEQLFRGRLRERSSLVKPKFLDDYIMATEEFVNATTNPETYEDAINCKEEKQWKEAMESEMASLKENKTWELTTLPRGAKAIPCKWVFQVKLNPDGSIARYKARLVVKGFRQRQGIDYDQTFSPVAKLGTIRSILSIAANEQMHTAQFDVSTAFLYGELEEVIHMKQPEGYGDGTEKVCNLKKSLYGLKQAPRCWYKRFGSFLTKLGFKISEADPCLYIRERNGMKLIIVLYVDDGLVAATSSQDLEEFLGELRSEFKIVSKEAEYYLGLEIKRDQNGIKISQKAFAERILDRFNFSGCKQMSTPIVKEAENSETGKVNDKQHNFPYRQAVGAIMYLMVGTRPDLAYSVGFLSRSLENPTTEDVTRVKRVLRYIAGTTELGIKYQREEKKGILECFSDSDFGGCKKTGRSTSGVVVKYAGGVVSWLSQRQAMVTTSTTEAEIVAANEAAKEVIWLKKLFEGIVDYVEIPIIHVDNSAAVRLAQNPEFHRRTKHISVKHFFIRERVIEGVLKVEQISSEDQVADVMTKPLPKIRLKFLIEKMGLFN